MEEHGLRLKQLTDRIEELERQVKQNQGKYQNPTQGNKDTQGPAYKPQENQKETYASKAARIPVINMDMEGNLEEQVNQEEEPQQMDWVKVKVANNKWKPRPELTDSMNDKVAEKLNKYVEDTMRQPDSFKTKAQKQMSREEREGRIESMFQRSAKIVGIGPISSEHIGRVELNLVKKRGTKEE